MATTVRISETYDMKTTVNRMGIIGIHTPSDAQVRKMYPGLMKNHKFIRFLKCDVVGACASVLPADPLQVGVSSGQVAPEDMFNPILYKAVTNESFDNLVNMVYSALHVGALGSLSQAELTGAVDNFAVYYSLLGEDGRFRKAMPQSGFRMRSLVPICHTLISTFGNLVPPDNIGVLGEDGETTEFVPDLAHDGGLTASYAASNGHGAITLRGKSVRMPKLPLHYIPEGDTEIKAATIPETFVGCIIVPPAKLHEFYYRMRVTWTIRFEQPVSNASIVGASQAAALGSYAYYQNYSFSKSETDLPAKESSVDADGVDVTKIMES